MTSKTLRTNTGYSTGKRYVEFYIQELPSSRPVYVGVDDGTQNYVSPRELGIGESQYYFGSVSYKSTGKVFSQTPSLNNVSSGGIDCDPYTTGDVVGMRVDLDGGSVSFYKNGLFQAEVPYPSATTSYVAVSLTNRGQMVTGNLDGQVDPPVYGFPTDYTYWSGRGEIEGPVVNGLVPIPSTEYYKFETLEGYSAGPEILGTETDFYNLYTWKIYQDQANDIRIEKFDGTWIDSTVLHNPGSIVTNLSLTFDHAGMATACWENNGQVYLYWHDPLDDTTKVSTIASGRSPFVDMSSFDEVLDPDRQIHLSYVDTSSGLLVHRLQEERYAVAYDVDTNVVDVLASGRTEFENLKTVYVVDIGTGSYELRDKATPRLSLPANANNVMTSSIAGDYEYWDVVQGLVEGNLFQDTLRTTPVTENHQLVKSFVGQSGQYTLEESGTNIAYGFYENSILKGRYDGSNDAVILAGTAPLFDSSTTDIIAGFRYYVPSNPIQTEVDLFSGATFRIRARHDTGLDNFVVNLSNNTITLDLTGQISLDSWHTVVLYKQGSTVTIYIDESPYDVSGTYSSGITYTMPDVQVSSDGTVEGAYNVAFDPTRFLRMSKLYIGFDTANSVNINELHGWLRY